MRNFKLNNGKTLYIQRDAESTLQKLASSFPIVAINGPRQSGKTTLAKRVFSQKSYVSLETPSNLEFAEADPKGFLATYETGAVIDEAQNCPKLFSYLQGFVDSKEVMGQFVLTGSQQFGLLSGISQSLAGRVGLLELLPFAISELDLTDFSLNKCILRGFYPPVIRRQIDSVIWFEDYVKTYLERDVRQLINVKNLGTFQLFLKLCAARAGQLLNLSELASSTGVDVKTIKAWLSVLESSYVIFILQPHYKNFSKKLVKTPKLYFYDSGLLCYLLNIRKEEDLALSPFRGQIFESMVLSEFKKQDKHFRKQLQMYFWRDNKGVECDILLEQANKYIPIEVKSGQTIQADFFKNLKTYKRYAAGQSGIAMLIYGGKDTQKREDIHVYPWNKIQKLIEESLS